MASIETAGSGRKLRNNHSFVVHEMGLAIISGQFPIGAILPGDGDLEQRFGVSRTVIREAMKTLSAKGLVIARSRVGTRVREKTDWNMMDSEILGWHFEAGVSEVFLGHLSEMRLSFEPYAAALAATHASPQDIENLFDLANDMTNAAHSREKFTEIDLQFHFAVLQASKNPFMRSVGSLIEAALLGIFEMTSPEAHSLKIEEVAADHRSIAQAIADKDPVRAKQAMENVIEVGRARLAGA